MEIQTKSNSYQKQTKVWCQRWELADPTIVNREWLESEYSPIANDKILEIGSGCGRDSHWLSGIGCQVTAVDAEDNMISYSKSKYPDDDISWVTDSLPNMSLINEQFDKILLTGVWQHIHPIDRNKSMRTMANLLSPNGAIILAIRIGVPDVSRSMYEVTYDEVVSISEDVGLSILNNPDLMADNLNRTSISWKTVILGK